MRTTEAQRPRTFFPTAINTFRQCPERYYHQYIRKLKRPVAFSRPMILGGATHRMIASILPRYMQTGDVAVDLEKQAREEIATSHYPEEELRYQEQDARDVVDLTLTALDMLPATSTLLLQERNLYARLGRSEVEIGARVDLVLQDTGGTVEHIDFKTGKVRDDTVQSLISRAVVGRRFRDAAKIQTTTLYLAHRQRQSAILRRESSRLEWQGIVQNIRDIRSIDRFAPAPGPLCEFCPYRSRDCSAW